MSIYDDLDLIMRACERMGYGVHYGRFVAETSPERRKLLLDEERRKQARRDAIRLRNEEKRKNKTGG